MCKVRVGTTCIIKPETNKPYGLYSNAETFAPVALGGTASNTLLMDEHNMLVY